MTQAEFASFAASVGLLLLMPGPTNALLMASGVAVGFRRTLPITLAALAGYSAAMLPLLPLAGLASQLCTSLAAALKLVAQSWPERPPSRSGWASDEAAGASLHPEHRPCSD